MKINTLLMYRIIAIVIILLHVNCISYSQSEKIRLNQVGFYIRGPKVAIVITDKPEKFYVVSLLNKDTVYRGNLGNELQSSYSPHKTRVADFSSINKAGIYTVYVPSAGLSYPFVVRSNVHDDVAKAAIKGFYYQRVSTALPVMYAAKWARAKGHPDDRVLIHGSAATKERPEGTVISSAKGWYDAGDYNKYIVNSGITMGTLLSLYEDFPSYIDKLSLIIPENKNAIPDELDEVLWNLRWMLTMQDPNDGGVYHKCTNASFDVMVMPDKATAPRYVVAKGTAATLHFAAVMAQAARVFKKFDKALPGLADSCKKASIYAWQWARKNPSVIYDQDEMNKKFEPKIVTGGYGDEHLEDEFIWAASELYITTKEDHYYTDVSLFPDDKMPLPSWGDVRLLGYYSLVRHEKELTAISHKDLPALKKRIVAVAYQLIKGVSTQYYQTVMGQTKENFIWGSNAVAANQSIALIQAYLITKEKKYVDNALNNLDYILGRNGTGYSFLTGYGDKSTIHPHHRPSEADGIVDPVPGLLAGGPNPGMQDKCTYASSIPDEAYADDVCSYASNEIAINWNAPLVYLACAMEALEGEVYAKTK